MAIDITVLSPATYGIIRNAVSADASNCEEVIGVPATGYNIIIDYLMINVEDALTVTVGEGKTGVGVTKALIGPLALPANGTLSWDFSKGAVRGMALSEATALTVDASGVGQVCIFVIGRIETC